MIRLSAAAEADLAALTEHYAALGRGQAIERLAVAVETASERMEKGIGLIYDAPRPYPALADVGLRWINEGSYWIAFETVQSELFVACIFYAGIDIPGRAVR